ncbi:hypothetical protein [Bacillus paralicheniformis]|nr:hypothetical protein [Bacillus paralicheniformis]UZN53032.1 hypothetical protein OPU65_13595 [Bacillus paralicheniformis]
MKLLRIKISAWAAVHLWGISPSRYFVDDEFREAVDHFQKRGF